MTYLVTGITGTVVPVIVEDLLRKDPAADFYFALRKDSAGNGIADRFEAVVATLDLEPAERERLRAHSRLVEIDIAREGLGIEPALRAEIVARVDRILHGAADVRFDQPYDAIRVPNLVFVQQVYALFAGIRDSRAARRLAPPVLYCLSTAYAYGNVEGPIPENYPDFHPGPPENSYARSKAEARQFLLERIRRCDDRIVLIEPTIIGGAASTGRTRAYHLHYLLLMLGYLGRLPFLCAPENRLDIVPVDWVAAVTSDVITRGEMRQGSLRLASGDDAITIRELHDAAYSWYVEHDPVPDHVIPKIRFIPTWCLPPVIAVARHSLALLHAVGRRPGVRRRAKEIAMLEGYLPYMTCGKHFENARSTALIRHYTGCGPAPRLQDRVDHDGRVVARGYLEKVLADTLATGWGGLVDFARLRGSARPRAVPPRVAPP